MSRLSRAFSQVVLAPQRLQVRPVETRALLLRIGQVESCDRADVIDVPRGAVLPRHSGKELPLEVSHQFLDRTPDQGERGCRLADACSSQCLRQCSTKTVGDGDSRLRRVTQALLRVRSRSAALLSRLAVALAITALQLLHSFRIGLRPGLARRHFVGAVLLPVLLAVLTNPLAVAGFPCARISEAPLSVTPMEGVGDSARLLGIRCAVLTRPLALSGSCPGELFFRHEGNCSQTP
jgi:hypothetical protein